MNLIPTKPALLATPEQKAARMEICRACPERKPPPVEICRKCGCVLAAKTSIPRASCPLGKW